MWLYICLTLVVCYIISWIVSVVFARTYSWKDRHVLITGGSEGCGFEVAKALALNHNIKAVTLVSRSLEKLQKAKEELKRSGAKIEINAISADVANTEQVKVALSEARKTSGPVHVVLAAAGLSIPKYFEDLSPEDFAKQMDINFFGVVNVARAFLTKETQSEERKFIAVSSIAAAVPFVGYAAYAPSKAALRSFVDVLRNEFQDVDKTSIHICFPPDMDTPGFEKENMSKPIECKKVWPEMFNEVFQAAAVAESIISNVSSNRYHLHSPDFFGNYLVSRAWGHYPRNFVALEVFLAPIFVVLHELMVWMTDRCVLKYSHHKNKK